MSLGFRDQKEARRRRWRLFRLLFSLAALISLGVVAYQSGTVLAEREVSRLQLEVDKLSKSTEALRDKNVQLKKQAEVAGLAETEWRERYETEVPTGGTLELLALIKQQIEKGADPVRIRFLVGVAANERSCDGAPVTRRFFVRTPLYEGANDVATFADKTIVASAQGESATDTDGNPEEWFDRAKPILLRFIEPGGVGTEASGILPMNHSVVRGDKEFRFSIIAAEREGFVSVTAERCAFP